MKKLILCILLSASLIQAQNLQSYLSTATFNSQEGSFLEIYLAIDANTLKLNEVENLYRGEIDIEINIEKEETVEYSNHYILKSPAFENKNRNNIFFFDQHRIPLKNGNYKLKITAFDKLHLEYKKEHTKEITIDYSDNIALSDIQLVSAFSEDLENNKTSKSGILLTPFVSNYYPDNIDTLLYYFEVYNTDKTEEKKYLIHTYIEKYETSRPLFNFNNIKRKTGQQFTSNLLSFNISKLKTGNYNLVCEVKNKENETITKKKLFFQRKNSTADTKKNHNINKVSTIGTFAQNITNKELLRQYIDYLYPISSPDENTFAQNQIKNDNIEFMQNFFYQFWVDRNNKDPELAWNQYHQKVKSVNKEFRNLRTKGYLTDRGRVYLQYGAPNSRHKVDNASASYPYEIWHYYKLNNQSDKKFVFINSDLATNEYRLEYSNVYGEVSNAEWHSKIKQNKSATFGDHFNNNYINPR
mgnify:CR=1 FL=1